MDLYDENFKIQDMIDSDIRSLRTEIEDYLSELSESPGSPVLSSLPPAMPMDVAECSMNSDISDDVGIGWMNSSQIYNISSDLDSVGGLLVNPETAMPVTVSQSIPTSVSLTPTASGTVNITLTTNTNGTITSAEGITLKSLAMKADKDSTHLVNVTLAMPTSVSVPNPTTSIPKGIQAQKLLSFHSFTNSDESDNVKAKTTKQKHNSKVSQLSAMDNTYPKPAYSYSCLIAMALKNSKTGNLPVNEIYDFMTENFPYFKTAPNGWKNSVRHNLSLNKCFEKIEKPVGNGAQRKGYLWALNPAKVEKMEEELQKWGSKDPVAIRKSMANPEKLELIEKGELNSCDDDMQNSIRNCKTPPVIQMKEEMEVRSPTPNNIDVDSAHNCFNADNSSNDFSPLGAPVGMDSNLPELDLQKGIWENLCDDRLFVSGSLINSSSPKHPDLDLEEADALPVIVTSLSDMPKSFIHANYIYACNPCSTSSLEQAHSDPLKKHPATVSISEKTTICDA